LSKLFCSILLNRLINLNNKQNFIPNNQIGYKKGARTTDHILTLKNIIDKYTLQKNRKYLFTCFVDFKSAFDTINRKALFNKLLKYDIGGNFLNILKNMYNEVTYRVKIDSHLLEPIHSDIGVKQGCVLSPTLFNLYLADLPLLFENDCKPVEYFHSHLNCLMFADDIVLMSETAEGLQNCLNKLSWYCNKWGLTVNTLKTKVVIFNKGGHKIKKFSFMYENMAIEICQHYTYLGITFSACGTFNKALKDIVCKASKVFYKLKQYDTRDNALLTMKLFDSLVTPVLSYGCEIWAPFTLKNMNDGNFMVYAEKCEAEKLNIKLCKYILGVGKYTTNAAVKGELGRFPLMINMLSQTFNYWTRICQLSTCNIVKISYLDNLCCNVTKGKYWSGVIFDILKFFDLENIWESQGTEEFSINTLLLKQKMKTCYIDNWKHHISREGHNKLYTYSTFKKEFMIENYILHNEVSKRRNFTKLRISAHNLAIETGRYTRPVTDMCDRICLLCDLNVIENESHLLFECPLYSSERQELNLKLSEFSTFDLSNATEDYFNTLMTCNNGDTEFITPICQFINACFTKRADFLLRKNSSSYEVRKEYLHFIEFLRLSRICLC
jgi:hypothetical protein